MKKRIISAILLVFVAVVALIPTLGFNAEAADTTITFNLGANNGTAGHKDGSTAKTTYEETVNGYKLNITNGNKMYPNSYDAKGNSCLKLGSSSAAGSFSFTVPDEVTSVIIHAAGYKAKAGSLKVNDTEHKLKSVSDNGEYDQITVDTSELTAKKVTIVSVKNADIRAMINTIEFVIAAPQCNHTNTSIKDYVAPTCTKTGFSGDEVCDVCGETITTGSETEALGHTPGAEATCDTAQTCTVCNAVLAPATEKHNFVDGACSVCGLADPSVCIHENTSTVGYKAPDCINKGYTGNKVCDNCEEIVEYGSEIAALGHTPGAEADCTNAQTCTVCGDVITEALGHDHDENGTCHCGDQLPLATFVVNGETVDSTYAINVSLPAAPQLPDMNYSKDYTFVGWAKVEQDGTTVKPTVYAAGATVNINEDTAFYAVYSYDAEAIVKGYVKKELSKIADDDIVVITMATSSQVYALTNKGGTSSAPTAVVIKVSNDCITSDITDDLKWNITNDENLKIYFNGDASKYLYCINNNNGVRAGSTNDSASYNGFTVKDGYLYNTGRNRYVGVYTTNPDWRSYTSINDNIKGQTLAFYVYSDITTTVSYYTTSLEYTAEFSDASLNVGSDLSIRYHALPGVGSDLNDYTVRFTMNGQVTEVKGVLENGKYVFSFCGITPQCMGDSVKAELILNGEVIDTVEEFSVKSYVVKAFENHADNAILLQFLSDMLHYGAEAQIYVNYKTDALVTDGIELYEASNNAPAEGYDHKSIVTEDGYDKTLAKFTAAGVNFDYNNRIFVKLTGSDLANAELYVNGALIEIEEIGEGKYIAYSYAISALKFEDEFEFELYYDGELAQTLTYTVADYVVAMQGDVEISSLVNALYNYGMSAKEYDTNK